MQKITKILYIILILWSTLVPIGCRNSTVKQQLTTIDSLLATDKLTDAEKELKQLRRSIMNESEQAKYNLLSILTTWRLCKPVNNTDDLDKSIVYYEQYDKDGLLARCYFLKGELLADQGKINESMLLYKKAEQFVAKEDLITQHHIYESLAFYNTHNGSIGLAAEYVQKALSIAKQLHRSDWEGYEYYLLILSNNALGNKKESEANVQCLLRLLPRMSEKGQHDVLEVLGQYYQLRNPQLMEQFMQKAMRHKENLTPYLFMAAHRYNQGNKSAAYYLLDQAEKKLKGKSNYALIEVKRDMKLNDKDYQSANQLSMQLVQLDDSILRADNRKDVEAVQNNFEKQLKAQKQQRTNTYIIAVVLVLILSICILIIYFRLRVLKMRSILSDDKLEISFLQKQIMEAKQQSCTETIRIEQAEKESALAKEIAKIEERHNGILAIGHQCYEEVLKGKNIITWDKLHFKAFVEYYKIVDASYLNKLEREYNSLTDRNRVIFILKHIGLPHDVIAERLGVGEGAIRTALSRLKKKRKKQ